MASKMLQAKNFSFTVATKDVEAALKKVNAIAGATGNPLSTFLSSDGASLFLLAVNSDSFASIAIEAKVDGFGCFGFDAQSIVGLIKGRAALAFAFNGSECKFKQVKGSYNGHIVTQPITRDMAGLLENNMSPVDKSGSNIPGELLAMIGDGLKATAISDVYQGTALLTYIKMDGSTLQMSSFATQHFALYRNAANFPKVKINIALPSNYFSVINAVSEGNAAKLYMSSANLRVQGKGFVVVLPSSQVEEKHFNTVAGLVDSLKSAEFTCTYNSAAMLTAVENLITLYSTNTNFEFVSSKDNTKLAINFTTQSGSASDNIAVTVKKGSKPIKVSADPRLIKDVVSVTSACSGEPVLATFERVIMVSTSYNDANVHVGCSKWE